MAFVADLSELAETADQPPDSDIRYSKVKALWAGGLTHKDFDLIAQIDPA
jgi:pterin-4a-carbinolamine dehydratase